MMHARPKIDHRTKEDLERQKLVLEIKFIRLTFLVQLLNTLAVAAIPVVVFIFFQRPQIDEMSGARAASERQHVENMALRIFQLKTDSEKRVLLDLLQKSYPQFSVFLDPLARSYEPKPDATKDDSEPVGVRCAATKAEIQKQNALLADLTDAMKAELFDMKKGDPNDTSVRGVGPVYQFLHQRKAATENYLAQLSDDLSKCK
jgi:hypothetical protein